MMLHESSMLFSHQLKRGIFVFLIVISILIPASYRLVPDMYPETGEKNISVKIEYKGAYEKDIEKLINKLEQPLSAIPGLKSVYSVSEGEKGTLYCSFSDSKNYDDAYMEVRDCVNRVYTGFPENVQRPVLSKSGINNSPLFAASFPLKDDSSFKEFRDSKSLKKEFEEIDGCGEVETGGLAEEEIIVIPDSEKIISSPFRFSDIINRIRQENFSSVITPPGRSQIKTGRKIDNSTEINQIYLKKELLLSDFASAETIRKKGDTAGRIDGEKTLVLYAFREGDISTVSLCRQLKIKAQKLGGSVIFNRGEEIEKALSETAFSVAAGIAAVIISALIYFRKFSFSILVILNILFSILSSAAGLRFTGCRLDIISLSGMAVVSGLAIDNSIILLDKYKISGSKIRDAIDETFYPLLFSLLTTSAVFVPLIFASEKTMIMFKSMAVSVTSGLAASFIFTFYFIPLFLNKKNRVHKSSDYLSRKRISFSKHFIPYIKALKSSIFFLISHKSLSVKYDKKISEKQVKSANRESAIIKNHEKEYQTDRDIPFMQNRSLKILKFLTIKKGIPFLLIFIMISTSVILILNTDYKPFSFRSRNRITFFMEFHAGTRFSHVEESALSVEKFILQDKALSLTLKAERERARFDIKGFNEQTLENAEDKIRKIASDYRGVFFYFPESESEENSYDINIFSQNIESAASDAYRLGEKIKSENPGLEVIYHFKAPAEGFKVIIDTEKTGSITGSAAEISRYIYTLLSKPVISKYFSDEAERDIRFGSDSSFSPEKLKELPLSAGRGPDSNEGNTETESWKYLKDIAELKSDSPPDRIYHRNRQRLVSLSVSGKNLISRDMEKTLSSFNYSSGCRGEGGSEYREKQGEINELIFLIVLAFFFIFTVLVVWYESLKIPLLILSGIPSSFAIPLSVMKVLQIPFSISTALALILSAGICVNNAILILSPYKENNSFSLSEVSVSFSLKWGAILTASFTTLLSILPLIFSGTSGILAPFSIILTSGIAGSLITLPIILASSCIRKKAPSEITQTGTFI